MLKNWNRRKQNKNFKIYLDCPCKILDPSIDSDPSGKKPGDFLIKKETESREREEKGKYFLLIIDKQAAP